MTDRQTIFITGATDGLGRTLAHRLAADGATLILHGRDSDKLESTADDLMLERGYTGSRAYGQSKLAQIMSGFELAGRIPAAEVTVNSLHPATYMPTKMVLQEIGRHIDSLDDGVFATRRLVTDPGLAQTTGRFFDRTHETRANAQAYDPHARADLWRRSLELVEYPDLT